MLNYLTAVSSAISRHFCDCRKDTFFSAAYTVDVQRSKVRLLNKTCVTYARDDKGAINPQREAAGVSKENGKNATKSLIVKSAP